MENEIKAGGAQAEGNEESSLTLSRPITFEGKEYTCIDLSGLAGMNLNDLSAASNYLTRKGIVSAAPETTFDFAVFIASRATGLPMELFAQMGARDIIAIKNRVINFFYG